MFLHVAVAAPVDSAAGENVAIDSEFLRRGGVANAHVAARINEHAGNADRPVDDLEAGSHLAARSGGAALQRPAMSASITAFDADFAINEWGFDMQRALRAARSDAHAAPGTDQELVVCSRTKWSE